MQSILLSGLCLSISQPLVTLTLNDNIESFQGHALGAQVRRSHTCDSSSLLELSISFSDMVCSVKTRPRRKVGKPKRFTVFCRCSRGGSSGLCTDSTLLLQLVVCQCSRSPFSRIGSFLAAETVGFLGLRQSFYS